MIRCKVVQFRGYNYVKSIRDILRMKMSGAKGKALRSWGRTEMGV